MAVSFLASLLMLSGIAAADLATEPPEGATEAALLVCEDVEACADTMWLVLGLESMEGVPLLLVDALVAAQDTSGEGTERFEGAFSARLAAAREAYALASWSVAAGALDDAERILSRWSDTPTNQELFELSYLRGAVRRARGEGHGHQHSFAQAATAAWNRSVDLPETSPEAEAAYYEALEGVVTGGLGTVHLEPGLPGTVYYLDGVELGEGPVEVTVFAGAHRLTARQPAFGLSWSTQVEVLSGQTSTRVARFSKVGDVQQLNGALAEAMAAEQVPPGLGAILGDYAERYGLREVILVRARPVAAVIEAQTPVEEDGSPGAPPELLDLGLGERVLEEHVVQELRYDPRLRRFVR